MGQLTQYNGYQKEVISHKQKQNNIVHF